MNYVEPRVLSVELYTKSMNKSARLALWFSEINKNDIPLVGGKGANLGEMYAAGIPVPNGFVVTSKAYFDFIKSTSLRQKILTELSGLDIENSKELMEASKKIKTAIFASSLGFFKPSIK